MPSSRQEFVSPFGEELATDTARSFFLPLALLGRFVVGADTFLSVHCHCARQRSKDEEPTPQQPTRCTTTVQQATKKQAQLSCYYGQLVFRRSTQLIFHMESLDEPAAWLTPNPTPLSRCIGPLPSLYRPVHSRLSSFPIYTDRQWKGTMNKYGHLNFCHSTPAPIDHLKSGQSSKHPGSLQIQ